MEGLFLEVSSVKETALIAGEVRKSVDGKIRV